MDASLIAIRAINGRGEYHALGKTSNFGEKAAELLQNWEREDEVPRALSLVGRLDGYAAQPPHKNKYFA